MSGCDPCCTQLNLSFLEKTTKQLFPNSYNSELAVGLLTHYIQMAFQEGQDLCFPVLRSINAEHQGLLCGSTCVTAR